MFLFSRPFWVRRLVHSPCQGVYDHLYEMHERLEEQYERLEDDHNALAAAAYRTDEALSESAEAHEEAETELAEARERIEALEAELTGARAETDQARAAVAETERLLTTPLTFTRPTVSASPTHTALYALIVIRGLLRREGEYYSGHAYGEHLHQLADALQYRLNAAVSALEAGRGEQHCLDLLQAPLLEVGPSQQAVT